MTEIKTTGIKGVINTISMFSSVQEKEVYEVNTLMNENLQGYKLSINMMMLMSQIDSIVNTGKGMTPSNFINYLDNFGGRISSEKELNEKKKLFYPEFNTGTDKIGEEYRGIANKVMLISRADFHQKYGNDLMLYQYIEMLQGNSAFNGK